MKFVDDVLIAATSGQSQFILNRLYNTLFLILNNRIVIDDLHQSQSVVNFPLVQ
jgi:hypothetical protein